MCISMGVAVGLAGAYRSRSDERGKNAALEKFRHRTATSYCYELQLQHRLESVANVHTAADLHVRPGSQNRADSENLGRREHSKRYIKP
jgi:hypothetical protein